MSQDSTETSVAAAQHGGISHLRPWRKGESGNPHGRAVRAVKLFEMMAPDFGELTAVDAAVLLQACRLMAKSEKASAANDAVRLANAAARLLASLRHTRRKPGRPSLLRDRVATAEVGHAE